MTPAQRVINMLRGETVDHIPFTSYENKVYYGKAERELRAAGMTIVQREPNFFTTHSKDCSVQKTVKLLNQREEVHIRVETPKGVLTAVDVDRGLLHNAWHEKMLFADERDYPALKAYLSDMSFRENYEGVRRKIDEGQGDILMRGQMGYSPFQHIIYTYMGIEKFSFEWADNRSRILELYEILCAKRRELYPIAAAAPQLAINICGNVTATVVSPQLFRDYYLPIYNETADELHKGGRLVGVHFDGVTLPYADAIRESRLDYIEALTPPPTCDTSVAQAHELWPDKAIWINFPSSVHMEPAEVVRQTARRLLAEAQPEKRFLMGITEDVPGDRWPITFPIILEETMGHPVG